MHCDDAKLFVTAAKQFMRKVIFRYPPMMLLKPVKPTMLHYIEFERNFTIAQPAIEYIDTAVAADQTNDAQARDNAEGADNVEGADNAQGADNVEGADNAQGADNAEATDAEGADNTKGAEFVAIDAKGDIGHVTEAWTLKDIEEDILNAIASQAKTAKPKKGFLRRFTNIFRKHIPRKATQMYNDLRGIFQ